MYVKDSISPYCSIDPLSTYTSRDLEILSLDVKKPGLKFMKISCISSA